MTNNKLSESQDVTIRKSELADTAAEMEQAAVAAAIVGQQEAVHGAKRIESAGQLAADGQTLLVAGARDVPRAMDEKLVSDRLAVIGEAVAVAGVVDVAEGAAMLAESEDVGVMSALVGMMSKDDLDHGLELARLAGELLTVSDIVEELQMPVLADFLAERSDRLHAMSLEQIHIAASTEGVSQLLASSGTRISHMGDNEVEEGMLRMQIAQASAAKSAAMSQASEELAAQGIEEVVVGGGVTRAARSEAVEGVKEISSGSMVMGAAQAIDDVATHLKEQSE